MDGIDAALADLSQSPPRTLAAHTTIMPVDVRDDLLALCAPCSSRWDQIPFLDVRLGELFAEAVLELIVQSECDSAGIEAIGSHGQTVRHHPHGALPFSQQIGDPNIIAARTGITTVADFRRADMAAGGHGAPLVPAYHRAVLQHPNVNRLLVNIGGIANVTVLPGDLDAPILGFDTGPGNVLLDAWVSEHRGLAKDTDAHWASTGLVSPELLAVLKDDPYFSALPPKSTGREYFNMAWLQARLSTFGKPFPPRDVQRTLCALSAGGIADSLRAHAPDTQELFVCGGGAHNPVLLEDIQDLLPEVLVQTTAAVGMNPDFIEAMAFAWLAQRRLAGLPGNIPSVTGARHPVVLGGIYHARGVGET